MKGKITRIDEGLAKEFVDIRVKKMPVEKKWISDRRITQAIRRHPYWSQIKTDIIKENLSLNDKMRRKAGIK